MTLRSLSQTRKLSVFGFLPATILMVVSGLAKLGFALCKYVILIRYGMEGYNSLPVMYQLADTSSDGLFTSAWIILGVLGQWSWMVTHWRDFPRSLRNFLNALTRNIRGIPHPPEQENSHEG